MMQHQVNVSARFIPETLEQFYAWCVIVVSTSAQWNMAAASDAQNIKYRIDRCQPTVGRLTV